MTGAPHALVYDNGLFLETAVTLANAGWRVDYFVPWESATPRSNLRRIGQGFPGVNRLESPWDAMDEADILIFTDAYSGALQVRERDRHGKRVWGQGLGEELELLREDTKAYMKEHGCAIGEWVQVVGIDTLREYLQKHKNVFVKTSAMRGDFESFCSDNYVESKPRCDKLERDLGPLSADYPFVVEKKIEDAVEIALDIYCVDGKFPTRGLTGLEVKGKAYVGHFSTEGYWPRPLRDLYACFSDTLADYKYRQMFAAEARITKDGTPYLIDPCTRMSSPCSELQQVMYTNLPEIIWEGSGGKLVDPVPPNEDGEMLRWGAELMLYSSWVEEDWCPVRFPKEIAPCVKLHNAMMKDGVHYVIPSPLGRAKNVGAVVAVGRTMDEATKRCLEYAEQVRAPDLEFYPEAFRDAEKELDKLAAFGLKM